MHPTLRSKFLQMEAELDKLVRDLSDISDEKLKAKPIDGGWSVSDVMQHLIMVEKGSMAYVRKKSSYPDSFKKADWSSVFRKASLKFFLYAPFKFKAPKIVNETKFNEDADMEDLVEEWRAIRVQMMNFLEEMPDEYMDKLIFRHAFAGRLTLDGMLLFIRDHFRRHRKQIDRLLKN